LYLRAFHDTALGLNDIWTFLANEIDQLRLDAMCGAEQAYSTGLVGAKLPHRLRR
jgi:hypothetical protein